ncbi:MAG: CHAD domain-containing protein [Rhodospirillaceae bacterium]|nr:CHAD domain-containing protein [Rhodospirillaceae bacterium]
MTKRSVSNSTKERTAHVRAVHPQTDVDGALAIILTNAQMRWLNRVGAASAGQIEGVHELRVGLRRLRSALTLMRDYIPPKQRSGLDAELKWLLGALAPVRDLDVFIHEHLHAMSLAGSRRPAKEQAKETEALTLLKTAAHQARTAAQRRARAALISMRHRRLVQRVSAWILAHEWRVGRIPRSRFSAKIGKIAQRILNARLSRIHKQGRRIHKRSAQELHDLRISIKKVRYGLGFFKGALPLKTQKRARKLLRILTDLQSALGHLNDTAMAEHIVAMLVRRTAGADARRKVAKAGARIIARLKKTATDARSGIAPRWKALKSFGTI